MIASETRPYPGIRVVRDWRSEDPPRTRVDSLGPDDLHKRIVIRSKNFIGTVYGTLLGVRPHPRMVHFTCVQLYGKKEFIFRNDTEVLVLDF